MLLGFSKIILTITVLYLCTKLKQDKILLFEKQHVKIMRETADECTLFLKKNNEFPIKEPGKVLLIGSGARNTVKGGGIGSGDVESRYYIACEQGLENAGFIVTSKEWLDKYPHLKEQQIGEHMNYIKNMHLKNNVTFEFRMVAFP